MNRLMFIAAALLAAVLLAGCGGGKSDASVISVSPERKASTVQATGGQLSAENSLSVQRLVLKAERRIGRTLFEYDYQLLIQNQGQAVEGASATLIAVGVGTTIIDGQVTVGAIASGSSVMSEDIITLRHNRSQPFDSAALDWRFSIASSGEISNVTVRLSETIGSATLGRINQIITGVGATTVSLSSGGSATVPMLNATPLLFATDREGAVVLATLAPTEELSESSTAVALLWLWMKPAAGSQIDDQAFSAIARRATSFERLVASVAEALAAGTDLSSTPRVLTDLNQVAFEVGALLPAQAARMRALGQIAPRRLQGSLDILQTAPDKVTGNIFLESENNRNSVLVFNGTALYWSAYTQRFDGQPPLEPDLLSPVTVSDAIRYNTGARPTGEFTTVPGQRVAYDFTVLQDQASRRSNALMIVRNGMGALLGTAALNFGGSVECLNEFIEAIAPAELEAVAASADRAAVNAYVAAYRRALANATLSSLTLGSCTGDPTFLSRLSQRMPRVLAGLKLFNDALALEDGVEVRDKAMTWLQSAGDFAFALGQSHVVGVCVATGGNSVTPCAERYELSDAYPWIEGSQGKLPLVGFARGNEPTLLSSTLRISSQNMWPPVSAPHEYVRMQSAGDTTLRLQDEPTGYDSSTLVVRVERGQLQYASVLGSATSGPLRVGETRALSVVANSNHSQFQGDVDFTFRVAAGGESVVELRQIGQRTASVKGLRVGMAMVYAINAVTGRELAFEVVVQPKITVVLPVQADFWTNAWYYPMQSGVPNSTQAFCVYTAVSTSDPSITFPSDERRCDIRAWGRSLPRGTYRIVVVATSLANGALIGSGESEPVSFYSGPGVAIREPMICRADGTYEGAIIAGVPVGNHIAFLNRSGGVMRIVSCGSWELGGPIANHQARCTRRSNDPPDTRITISGTYNAYGDAVMTSHLLPNGASADGFSRAYDCRSN